jgi:hypothetical protein
MGQDMSREWKFAILIAVAAALVLRYVIFPDKVEFAHFVEVSKTYVAPLIAAVSIVGLVGALYAFNAKIDRERQQRVTNVWFWATSVFFAVITTCAVLYVKIFPAQTS